MDQPLQMKGPDTRRIGQRPELARQTSDELLQMKGPDGKVLEDDPGDRIGKDDNHELGDTDLVDDGIHRINMSQVIMAPLEAVLVPDDDSSIASSEVSKSSGVTPHIEQSTSNVPSQSQIQFVRTMSIIYEAKKVQISGVGNFLAHEITLPFGCWVKCGRYL